MERTRLRAQTWVFTSAEENRKTSNMKTEGEAEARYSRGAGAKKEKGIAGGSENEADGMAAVM